MGVTVNERQRYAAVMDFITWPKPDPGIAGVTKFSHGMIVHFTAPSELSARRRMGRLTPRKPRAKGRWVTVLFRELTPIVVKLQEFYEEAGAGQWRDPYGWRPRGR